MVGVGADRAGPSPRRLLILITVTALVLMTLDARDAPGVDAVRGVAGVVMSPIRAVVGWAADPFVDGWRGAVHIDAIEADVRAGKGLELGPEHLTLPNIRPELANLLS